LRPLWAIELELELEEAGEEVEVGVEEALLHLHLA
jgi:hypothetical protein